jgi:hypothetical protein
VSGIFLPLRVNSLPLATIYEVKIPLRKWKKIPFAKESRSDDIGQYMYRNPQNVNLGRFLRPLGTISASASPRTDMKKRTLYSCPKIPTSRRVG